MTNGASATASNLKTVVIEAAKHEAVLNSSAFLTTMGWIESANFTFNAVNGEAFIDELEKKFNAVGGIEVVVFLESYAVMLDIMSVASGLDKKLWREMACAGLRLQSENKTAIGMHGRFKEFGGHSENTIERFKASNAACASFVMRAFYYDLFFVKCDIEDMIARLSKTN